MSIAGNGSLSRKQLTSLCKQLANDRKLDILAYAAEQSEFPVAELEEELGLAHTTAHEYCRDLQDAGLLERTGKKPATYAAVEFELNLSLSGIADALDAEAETVEYVRDRYGEGCIDEVLDVWERVEAGDLTYREASEAVGMDHADFLRIANELELLRR